MAALHIRTAAKLCHSGFNQSKTQQALVESFLGHHEEAVDLLKTLLRSPAVFSLMGRIQFKAKRHEDAVGSFRQAIALVVSPVVQWNIKCCSQLLSAIKILCRQLMYNSCCPH